MAETESNLPLVGYMISEGCAPDSRAPAIGMEEIREYVEAFRTSSDRARVVLYFLVVATLLVGIANNNARKGGWPLRRIDDFYGTRGTEASEEKAEGAQPGESRGTAIPEPGLRYGTLRDEYHRQFVANALVTRTPIPGVWIDTNDLGVIGGLALLLLMILLLLCLAREHENLYLSLYRVRQVSASEAEPNDGSSRANLLYHALAMRQVLAFPPTLARWDRVRYFQLGWVFFAPPLVQAWVLWENWHTRDAAARLGANLVLLLGLQAFLASALLLAAVCAFSISQTMAWRWRSAFERVNPGRSNLPQSSMLEWAGPRVVAPARRKPLKDGLIELDLSAKPARRAASQIIDEAHFTSPPLETIDVAVEIDVEKGKVALVKRDEMVRELLAEGIRSAEGRSASSVELVDFEVVDSEINGKSWVVLGRWQWRRTVGEETTGQGRRARWISRAVGSSRHKR